MFELIKKDQPYKVRDLVVKDSSGKEFSIPERKKQIIITDAIKNNVTKIKPIVDKGEKMPKLYELTYKADLQKGLENGVLKLDEDNIIVRNVKTGHIAGKGAPVEYKPQIKKNMLTKLAPTMDLAAAVVGQIQLEEIKKELSEIKKDVHKLLEYEEQKPFQILNGIAKTIVEAIDPETRQPTDSFAMERINDQIQKLNDEIEIIKGRCLSEIESAVKDGYDVSFIKDWVESTFRKPENYDLKNQKAFGDTLDRLNAYLLFLSKSNELLIQCYNVLNSTDAAKKAQIFYDNTVEDVRNATAKLYYGYFKRISINVRGLSGADTLDLDKITECIPDLKVTKVNNKIITSATNTQRLIKDAIQKCIGQYTISFLMEGATDDTDIMPDM